MADSLHVAGYLAQTHDAQETLKSLRAAGSRQSDLSTHMPSSEGQDIHAMEPSEIEPTLESSTGLWNGVVNFLKAESHFDPYSKESLGSEAVHAAGQPCHGGYAYERERAASEESTSATLLVNRGHRNPK